MRDMIQKELVQCCTENAPDRAKRLRWAASAWTEHGAAKRYNDLLRRWYIKYPRSPKLEALLVND